MLTLTRKAKSLTLAVIIHGDDRRTYITSFQNVPIRKQTTDDQTVVLEISAEQAAAIGGVIARIHQMEGSLLPRGPNDES